ncbi:DUF4381 domain-containing protein [Litoribacillus peritrichatus]
MLWPIALQANSLPTDETTAQLPNTFQQVNPQQRAAPLQNTLPAPQFQQGTPSQQANPLKDLGTPFQLEPISPNGPFVWPPAYGWWGVGVASILAIVSLAFWFRNYLKRKKIRTRYYNAFSSVMILNSNATEEEQTQYIHQLNKALKAIALDKFGHETVATLNGKAWLEFLDQTGNCNHFTKGSGQVFGQSLYQAQIKDLPDCEHLMSVCQGWVKEIC